MKKLIISAALIAVSALAFGQQKGDIELGASISGMFQTDKSKGTESLDLGVGQGTQTNTIEDKFKNSYFVLSAQGSYFVMDKLAVGLGLNIGAQSDRNQMYDDANTSLIFGLHPFVDYYLPIKENFWYVPELCLNYNRERKTNVFGMTLYPAAFQYRVNRHLAVNASPVVFDFSHSREKYDSQISHRDVKYNNTVFNIQLLNFGISYYL